MIGMILLFRDKNGKPLLKKYKEVQKGCLEKVIAKYQKQGYGEGAVVMTHVSKTKGTMPKSKHINAGKVVVGSLLVLTCAQARVV